MQFSKAVSPKNLEALTEALKAAGPGSRLIAGGTDFTHAIHNQGGEFDLLINLDKVKEMRDIRSEGDRIIIGAGLPFSEIGRHPLIMNSAACLVGAASQMGSPQIRNRATIGGNIANASACADSIAPLLVLNAKVIVVNSKGERRERLIPEIIIGTEKNSLQPDEVILAVAFPVSPNGFRSSFGKLGAKLSVTISKINMALGFIWDPAKQSMSDVRAALGAVGTCACRFPSAEAVLEGALYSEAVAGAFAEQASRDVEEAIKTRASMPYKRRAVKGLALDVLGAVFS